MFCVVLLLGFVSLLLYDLTLSLIVLYRYDLLCLDTISWCVLI